MLILRNKNRYLYGLRNSIRRIIYSNVRLLKGYLKAKEIFINAFDPSCDEKALFEKVFIETISYCNNDCGFCPASVKAGAKGREHLMPEDLYTKILTELEAMVFKGSVAFYCNNEPLLDSRLVDWVRTARKRLKDNFLYLYTNGTLISVALANQLFDAGLDRIVIDNYNDRHELIRPIKDLVEKAFLLRGEVIVAYRWKNDRLSNRAGQNPSAGIILQEPLRLRCVRPSKEMVIGYDGTVPLCCADGLWKVRMGNVREKSLKDVWFSEQFKKTRRSLWDADRSVAETCRVCDAVNFSCLKGVRI